MYYRSNISNEIDTNKLSKQMSELEVSIYFYEKGW